jgi:hypothetical protein
MVFEYEIPNFFEWFVPAIFIWFPLVVLVVAFCGWLAGFVVSSVRRGPVEGFYAVAKIIATGVSDLANTSIRRTYAIALLAVQEAIRRKVLVAFAVFVLAMLFAGWYLDVKSDDPARLYLSFVLTTSNYLVLILALLISSFSLPADIKNRTIYTIVTKPVRSSEIILGRVLGFSFIGTFILAAMCLVSYVFVVRGMHHEHRVESAPGVAAQDVGSTGPSAGQTTFDSYHRHTFDVAADGIGETNVVMGHKHEVRRIGTGDQATYEMGPPIGSLQARNPIYGNLGFLDRSGQPSTTGINVGHEWLYRSYVEGGTLGAAIWKFDGITANRFPNGFDLEMNLRAFRTHKGNIERGVRGVLFLQNPNPNAPIKRSEDIPFVVKEFTTDRKPIAAEMRVITRENAVQDGNVFESLCDNGQVEVHIICADPGQYLGMAKPDLYILDQSTPFWINFIKGYVGIWLQMVLVTTFGVMFSTFLSAPVAMMATISSIVVGYFGEFIAGVTQSTVTPDSLTAVQGGGPLESLIRIIFQLNLQVDPEIGNIPFQIVRAIDFGFMHLLSLITVILPNYVSFSTAEYVANGFNIDAGTMTILILKTLAYFVVVSLVGFFFLKTRELAAT